MKLYTYDGAPSPARLKMFMDYKGIELDTQQVDMTKLEQQSDWYLAINPEGTIPALVLDDGTVLTAVIAIVQYLEALYPERPLLGRTPEEKALVLNWNQRLFNTLFMAVAEALRNGHPAFADRALPGPTPLAQIPELAERGKMRLALEFDRLNELLGDRDFLAGPFFSLADTDLLACIDFAKWGARTTPDPAHDNIKAWRDRALAELGSNPA